MNNLYINKITMGCQFFLIKIPMGLDRDCSSCLNKFVDKKLLLDRLGHRAKGGVKGYLESLLPFYRKRRITPLEREEQGFTEDVRKQFLKLAEKGLSIPVFTL